MRYLTLFVFAIALCALPAMAQMPADLVARIEVAKKIQALRPVRQQVDSAIERYVSRFPQGQRDVYASAIGRALNYMALEKISVDAYAEIYTLDELQAMYAYYSQPAVRSAEGKADQYADKVYPEIIRMLDRTMMRVKTGG